MEMGGEGNGTKHDGCPNPFSSCRHGHVPTRCKLRLTVLQRYYTKNLIENADYLKRATGWHGNHLHIVGIVLVNKHPMGRPASRRPRASRHTQVPLLGFLLELLCLEFVFLLFVCMFLFRLFVCLEYCTVWLIWRSVTHLLWDLVRVEDTRDRHLDFVFLLLGLTQRRLPLLQEQICGVLACKLLQRWRRTRTRGGQMHASTVSCWRQSGANNGTLATGRYQSGTNGHLSYWRTLSRANLSY